jgi:DNA-binding MarR family transcriptional regulator
MTPRKKAAPVAESPPSSDLTDRILLAGHLFELHLDQALAEQGLTARQFRALQHIDMTPGANRVELALALRVSREAVGGIAQRLHRLGLIDRAELGPGRPVSFTITELGSRRLRDAVPLVTQTEQRILGRLSPPLGSSLPAMMKELITELTQRS